LKMKMEDQNNIDIVSLMKIKSGLHFSEEEKNDISIIEQKIFNSHELLKAYAQQMPIEKFRAILYRAIKTALVSYLVSKQDLYNHLTSEYNLPLVCDNLLNRFRSQSVKEE